MSVRPIPKAWRDTMVALLAVLIPATTGAATLRYAAQLQTQGNGGLAPSTANRVFMHFAILSQGKTIWTSSSYGGGNAPGLLGAIPVTVADDGRFEILLGQPPTQPIPDATVPSTGLVSLRVWVAESGLQPFERLSPDQTFPVGAFLKDADQHSGNWRLAGTVLTTRGVTRIGVGTDSPASTLDVAGETTTHVLTITGGSDLSEPFVINSYSASNPEPGMVVSIDSGRPGELLLSSIPYDHSVAGVLSGAHGIQTGLVMRQTGNPAVEGTRNVAVSGRVFVLATTVNGPIEPGDLLTSSGLAGYAMKATDLRRARAAAIGKAMTSLKSGSGYVLLLVQPQ